MAMLLITHDLAVVSGMADQVALMYAGQIVEVASAADFFVRPSHPYAKVLLQALPGEDLRGRQLAAIHGTVPALTQTFHGCRFAPRCPYQTESCAEESVQMTALTEDHHVRCVRVHDVGLQAMSLPPLLDRSSIAATDHSVLLSVQNLSVAMPRLLPVARVGLGKGYWTLAKQTMGNGRIGRATCSYLGLGKAMI